MTVKAHLQQQNLTKDGNARILYPDAHHSKTSRLQISPLKWNAIRQLLAHKHRVCVIKVIKSCTVITQRSTRVLVFHNVPRCR